MLKPNEAMFEAALAAGKRLGMLATFEPSVAGMEAEFRDIAAAAGSAATLDSFCVAGAMKALQAGDGATHDRLIAEAAPRFRRMRRDPPRPFLDVARRGGGARGSVVPGADRAGRGGRKAEKGAGVR